MNCLVIDVGNTSTTIGRFASHGRVIRVSHVRGGIRDAPALCEQALRKAAGDRGSIDGTALASVVPAVNARWCRLIRCVTGNNPLLVTHRLRLQVRLNYPRPGSIGADRIANACGGVVRYGAPLVVADFGTALTFDVVDSSGAYIGGVIEPGLPLMTDYLHEKTALLPRVRLGGGIIAVGRSTRGAMRLGAIVGYRGMVRETVAHLRTTLGRQPHLCATGGYARWALQGSGLGFTIDPNLTLFGLGCIFERNIQASDA